jgi:hypothetical protein
MRTYRGSICFMPSINHNLNRKEKTMSVQSEQMSGQSEQMEEFRTTDKSLSRSLYLKFLGATVGSKETGIPCNGDYTVNGDISRFKNGLLHGGPASRGKRSRRLNS